MPLWVEYSASNDENLLQYTINWSHTPIIIIIIKKPVRDDDDDDMCTTIKSIKRKLTTVGKKKNVSKHLAKQ